MKNENRKLYEDKSTSTVCATYLKIVQGNRHGMAERIDECQPKQKKNREAKRKRKGEMKTYIHSDLIGEQTYKMCDITKQVQK